MLYSKAIVPPYKPNVRSPSDAENFAHFSSSDEYLVPALKEKDDPFLSWWNSNKFIFKFLFLT